MRHPGAPTLFLADCVAGRSLAGHTGCHGSFARLYCRRGVARRLVVVVSIGVRANIHLGGQTEFCPNGFSGGGVVA